MGRQTKSFTSATLALAFFSAFTLVSCSTGIHFSPFGQSETQFSEQSVPRLSLLMGGNGAPGDQTVLGLWNQIGFRFSRLNIYPYGAAGKQDLIDHGYLGDTSSLDAQILFNNENGISTLLILGFGESWNGTVPGDGNSKPLDESVWTGYVTAVVKKYSAAPYNVKYFQIWNEAAGSLLGGSLQSTFWHGPGYWTNLKPVSSGLCTDTTSGTSDNGAVLQQATCSGATSQNYAMIRLGGTQAQLVSAESGRCLEIAGSGIQLADCVSGNQSQLWTYSTDSSGAYKFASLANGNCLGVAGQSTSAGAALEALACDGSTSQSFKISLSSSATAYANAMSDYVDYIHIPAAKIVRSYGAYVVYGGWPDQGGLSTYTQWLEYVSAIYGSSMLDWTDYLDLHYLSVGNMKYLYDRYASTGKIRGVWQTEVGFDYMNNQNFIPQFYFSLAVFALQNSGNYWKDPSQFLAMVYSSSGGQSFMPINMFSKTLQTSGNALATLNSIVSGQMSNFTGSIAFSSGSTGAALYNNDQIVFQVIGPQGVASIDVQNLPARSGFTVKYYGAVLGEDLSSNITASSWSGNHLSIQLNIPAPELDLTGKYQNKLGYVVVTPGS